MIEPGSPLSTQMMNSRLFDFKLLGMKSLSVVKMAKTKFLEGEKSSMLTMTPKKMMTMMMMSPLIAAKKMRRARSRRDKI